MAIATLERLSYRYPSAATAALRDVSLTVDGGLTLVVGPSGGGKSTLLRVFNGLIPHFHGGRVAGRASVAGCDVVATPTRRLARSVGFVFQDPELQTVYATVDREVAFGLENMAVPAREIPARVHQALCTAGAESLAGRAMTTLSGGERQKVELASALAMRPELVVLDEPTSQLDPDGAALVLEAVRRLAAGGHAVVISEHRIEALAAVARHALLVDRGVVVETRPELPTARPRSRPPVRSLREGWSLRGVSAGFDRRAVLQGVDLCGGAGEVVVLNGPYGGGKTTMLRVIAGLMRPLAGKVERRPGRIAYLPQNPAALLHRPSVRDEVRFTLERSGEDEPPQPILDRLGLGHVADRYPRDLSSGERQRAALAAVLAGTPSLVLLDEPTRGMDAASRAALTALVAELRDRGAAVVIATHDAELRAAVADRVVRIGGGAASELAEMTA